MAGDPSGMSELRKNRATGYLQTLIVTSRFHFSGLILRAFSESFAPVLSKPTIEGILINDRNHLPFYPP